jgi:hypothetical protein
MSEFSQRINNAQPINNAQGMNNAGHGSSKEVPSTGTLLHIAWADRSLELLFESDLD